MNPCTLENCILIIFASPALEETLVDWLLENETISGFSTIPCFGHGSRPSAMSLIEQVAGRQKRVQFMIETEHEIAEKIIMDLHAKFPETGLHYTLMPVIKSGQV